MFFSDRYHAVSNRLELYFDQQPKATYRFYCVLQGLPDDKKQKAVLHCYVKTKLKEELGHRMLTFILMLDFYIISAVMACFGIAVTLYNQGLFCNSDTTP